VEIFLSTREYSVTTEPYRSDGEMRNAYKILSSQLKGRPKDVERK
jgi:hypothetical protein